MPYDVQPIIVETVANLNDAIDAEEEEQMLTSHSR